MVIMEENRKGYEVLDLGFDALTLSNLRNAQTAVNGGYVGMMIKTKLRKYFPRIAPLDKYQYHRSDTVCIS